jgi:hypothetical protein
MSKETAMRILTIRNAEALRNPEFVDFLREALAAFPYANPHGLDGCAEDIFRFIKDPDFFLFVGVEDGKFVTMAVLQKPTSQLFPIPTVFCAFNRGSHACLQAMTSHVIDTVAEMGYTTFRSANMSGHSDKVWLKAFGHEDLKFTPIGTVFDIAIK